MSIIALVTARLNTARRIHYGGDHSGRNIHSKFLRDVFKKVTLPMLIAVSVNIFYFDLAGQRRNRYLESDFLCALYAKYYLELTGAFSPSGTKISASESRQYLLPVGAGPSSKTCPRWEPVLESTTSRRIIPSV